MKNYFIAIILLWGYAQSEAQLILKSASSTKIKSSQSYQKQAATGARARPNNLPFWDDFHDISALQSTQIWGTDTTRLWDLTATDGVFVNSTLAANPPSFGVVTFDGLDASGQFHGQDYGLTDRLVSDTLALGAFDERDDIYLSFYWQAGGLVEPPDVGDSLVLEFYDRINGWRVVWSKDGAEAPSDSLFYQASIRFTDEFLSDTSRFRFSAYGDQNGPFDAWHLDWIYLNRGRSSDDLFYEDVSINGTPSLVFGSYRSLPLDHVDLSSLRVKAGNTSMNLNPEPDGIGLDLNYFISITDSETGAMLASSSVRLGNLASFFNADPLIVNALGSVDYGELALNGFPERDSVVLSTTEYVDGTNIRFLDNTEINLRANDTIRATHLLHNYYAYDDGTAEYALGTNVIGGQVAVQFVAATPDTLTDVDIYFPNIAPASDQRSLTLRVLGSLADVAPLRQQIITIRTGEEIDVYTRYELERPLLVSDTFYVAYEQNVSEYIGIGFDRDSPEAGAAIFENSDGTWVQNSRYDGAMMLRPVFQTGRNITLSEPIRAALQMPYPNPTPDYLTLPYAYEQVVIRDLSGQVVYVGTPQVTHDLRSLRPGLYTAVVYTAEGVKIHKILKK